MSLGGLLIVAAIAVAAPLAVSALPPLRIPSPVAEIGIGIAVGPALLNWVHLDTAINVLATLGLSMLLFLAGLEIDIGLLRGRVLRQTAMAIIMSLALALGAGYAMSAAGLVHAPLLIAITLAATALGLIIPLLKDADQLSTSPGVATVAGATVAEFTCITLLSLFFRRTS